ncbi:MAG: DEAD/DEAH box helicase [Planctomycetes bacterium]|nr:DEAD/DEAH box helicase [Planctomycetota bacterium]
MTVSFESLSIDGRILRALTEEGYTHPTPVQQSAIPPAQEGRDVLAVAPTGTGKTAAFTIPIIQRLGATRGNPAHLPRALILTPTRELALQVDASLRAYSRHMPVRTAVVLGGVGQGSQVKALRRGVDVLVATPGRLLDLMQQGHVRLDSVQFLVLDEADRMLDMGFLPDVKRIVAKVPARRQTLFFSATMPGAVSELANSLLQTPFKVEVETKPTAQRRIEQRVLFVDQGNKTALLGKLLDDPTAQSVLVFARTKHRADRIVKQLNRQRIGAAAIHSNKSQNARQRTLQAFTQGDLEVLVATDIVARGIDVDGITHVINYDLPDDPENHVHRIGRTARAGAAGIALSFCSMEELDKLKQIEKFTGEKLEVAEMQPYHNAAIAEAHARGSRGAARQQQQQKRKGRGRSRSRHRGRRELVSA